MNRNIILGLLVFIFFAVAGTIYSPTLARAATPHCGPISANETWSSIENVHTIGVGCDNVTVPTGFTLTITEGTIVKFDFGKSLIIDGTLIVQGTDVNPVYFTSYRDDTIGGDTNSDGDSTGARDDWDRIEFTEFSGDGSLIDHAVIRYGGSWAPYGAVNLLDASPTIQNTEITENRYCAITADMYAFPTLNMNNLHHNDANGLCLFGGTLDIDATWDITDTSYFVREDVGLQVGSTLTITEGVVVKFDQSKSLIINGTLDVQGTETDPVYFTSYRDDSIGEDTNGDGASTGARDDWDRIEFTEFSSDASLIDHAVIRYGGSWVPYGAVNLLDASPTIQNTEITENRYCAITADMYAFPTLNLNNLHHNDANGLCLYGGTLDIDATWDITDTSYFVRDDVALQVDSTLTVTEGVVVKFDQSKSLIINGTLDVQGTDVNPVYFTSYRDDTIGEDTNGDGTSTGTRDDWDRIEFTEFSSDASLIDHAIIRYGGSWAPYGVVNLLDASPTIQNTEITENRYCAITADMYAFPTLNANDLHHNDANGLCLFGGTLDIDATWDITDTSYFVRDDVALQVDSTLTVTEGVVVKFDQSKSLIINGTLDVQGTDGNPVYFTSYRDDSIGKDTNGDGTSTGTRDDWDRIEFTEFSSDASLIDHAVIRYGGSWVPYGAVNLLDASPTIQNTEITENRYCAITADMYAFPTLNMNDLHHNDANGLCLYGGTLDIDATWDITDTSYFIRGDVALQVGSTLAVVDGVVVKFDQSKSLIINGTLDVQGTDVNPVYFTSYRDDSIGEDTNGDGASTGTRDDWDRIEFTEFSSDASLIDYAIIRYGGSWVPYGAVNLLDASPTIQNTEITDNTFAGILVNSSTPVLGCNNIYKNSDYGVYNSTPEITVNAENQWWGVSSGPYHPDINPNGSGNSVTDGVDFVPWVTEPCWQHPKAQIQIYLPVIQR